MSSAVIFPAQPENILKGLSKLWTSLGHEEKAQGKPTVLRACSMTLVVASDEADGGYSASQIIPGLMREHPSRGIVLAVSAEAEHALEARVLAQCWKPFGKAQQICCEQIEIVARPESWPNVGPTLVGLTVPDLPVIFWCRHKAALRQAATRDQRAGLEAVLDLATKVIVDTEGESSSSAFQLISQLRGPGRAVADLEWARLTFWRQPIAQMFDNPARRTKFSDFHTIEIAHSDENPAPSVLYVAGWFSSVSKAKIVFKKEKGYGQGLQRISLISGPETITFARTGPECMHLYSTNGRERSYAYPEQTLDSLLNQELSVLGADPVFEAAFVCAVKFSDEP
jgi:glucose-6-phosphate dehydrogenase assembly protein OpcA